MTTRNKIERFTTKELTNLQKYSLIRGLVKGYENRTAQDGKVSEVYSDQNLYNITILEHLDHYYPFTAYSVYNYHDNTYTFILANSENPIAYPFPYPKYNIIYKTQPDQIDFQHQLDILNFILVMYASENQ